MTTDRISDADLARMLRARADRVAPSGIGDLVMGAVARERAAGAGPQSRRRSSRGIVLLIAAMLLVGASLATFLVTGRSRPTPAITAPVDLGIFAPVDGRIVYGAGQFGVGVEMLGVDPEAPTEAQTKVRLAAEPSTPLGWSNDGTELLLIRGPETSADQRGLFILHADGSETPVTDCPMAIRGAAISPDGSQVVFGADGALWTVDADGGPAKLLVDGRNGFVEDPAFSPDGTKIAYDDGVGDNTHRIWVVDADGRNAHDITPKGFGDCACHVYGIAWSPIEDRIAVGLEGTTYTFATDGSDLTPVINNGDYPHWSPDGSQIAYTITCLQDPNGCGLGIANADGSDPRGVGRAMAGPWHPGTHERPSSDREAIFDVALHVYGSNGDGGRLPDPTPINARVPDGWTADRFGMTMRPDAEHPLAISFWAIDAVFTDPCESEARADPPTVRSLDGLASGLTDWWRQDSSEPVEPRRDLPIVTEPVETTVSGLPARSLELRIPDELDTTTCFRGRYATWRTAEGVRRLHRPGDVSRIWVIQVRPGSMLVIDATSPGEPSPDGLAGLSEIIESLRIGGAA